MARLGAATDTLDAAGNVTEEMAWAHVDEDALARALPAFRGEVWQTPPM